MIEKPLSFPLDGDGFFRRECPLCFREFKVRLREDELGELAQRFLDHFMVEQGLQQDDTENGNVEERFCPYCAQSSPCDDWWTQEQLAYIQVAAKNMMAHIYNEHFARPMMRENRRHQAFIRIDVKEMQQEDEWISPERSDMRLVNLPCCDRQQKVADDWGKKVNCFFCGFTHPGNA